MQNDLIARYIYAVTRYLPEKARSDVEKELDGLIAEMLEAHCGDKTPAEADIRAVLTELGTPEELAAKYSGDENKALISGAYLMLYRRILRLVLPIAAAGIAFAGLLAAFLEWNPGSVTYLFVGETLVKILGGALAGAFQAFGVITIIFAVLERKKAGLKTDDMFTNLLPVPKVNAQIKPYEPVFDMIWALFAAVVLIGFPQILGAWLQDVGWVPVFNAEVLRGFWFLILLWSVFALIKGAIKLVDGQYTPRLAIVTAVANTVTLIAFPIVFLNQNLMNPDFIANIGQLISFGDIHFISWPLQNLNVLLVCIVFVALILETLITAVRTIKHD
ncbi:MAG TPA: hypothetical protein PK629_01400 [Oscillospiraceae bacterium]|nr:hypothetical protein [Oscillospiraceae bacterium]HPF56172.1 hypothetical protein [Clostridiales bacterium]HPK36049.1 hypothetical protein [Oscillospiraceae bacterium]HPR75980.1 hypothetical protein [Oscillospiraceae bacterium]